MDNKPVGGHLKINGNKNETTRRKIPPISGLYIQGKLNGIKAIFTTDTGATRTIISDRFYNKMPEDNRPRLQPPDGLRGPNNEIIDSLGRAVFTLQLDTLVFNFDAVVATITDEVLQGFDVLLNSELGPADILLSKGEIILGGVTIPWTSVATPNRLRHVTAADHYVIPAFTEYIIDAYVDRDEEGGNDNLII